MVGGIKEIKKLVDRVLKKEDEQGVQVALLDNVMFDT